MKNRKAIAALLTVFLFLAPGFLWAQEPPKPPEPPEVILERLCNEGNSTACFRMGERSRVVERDLKAAKKYFLKACDGGYITGCTHAGILIQMEGKQYSPQWKKAAKLFKKGCDVGSDKACFNLGSLKYREGRQSSAIKYYKKACDLGNQVGCQNHQELIE